MLSNRETVRKFVVREEGGYSSDSRDGGNWSSGRVGVGTLIGSNMGVGAPALIAVRPEMRFDSPSASTVGSRNDVK